MNNSIQAGQLDLIGGLGAKVLLASNLVAASLVRILYSGSSSCHKYKENICRLQVHKGSSIASLHVKPSLGPRPSFLIMLVEGLVRENNAETRETHCVGVSRETRAHH